MRTRFACLVTLLAPALLVVGTASLDAQQTLTFEQAETAVAAAEAEAERNGWNLTIVVTDADGVPLLVTRRGGASQRTHMIAMAKTRTVLASGMPSGDYGKGIADGTITDTIPDGITFEGGYPIRIGGVIVGAMSASGARGSEDAQVVRVGLSAIGATF